MSDPVVTVAKFTNALEAELARNFLESNGITAIVAGDNVSTLNVGALGGLAQIYVRESDATRAAELLAEHFDKAELEADWEDRIGEDNVWVCPTCGTAVNNALDTCDACATPRDAIQSKEGVSRRPTGRREETAASQGISKPAEIAADAPPPKLAHEVELDADFATPDIRLYAGDALALRALRTALLGFFCIPIACYSGILLAQIYFGEKELSPRGRIHCYWATAIFGAYFAMSLFVCLARHSWVIS